MASFVPPPRWGIIEDLIYQYLQNPIEVPREWQDYVYRGAEECNRLKTLLKKKEISHQMVLLSSRVLGLPFIKTPV